MIGKIGTVLGEHGINIASTAVGREPDHEPGQPGRRRQRPLAVMVVTVDSPVPDEVIQRDRLARGLPGRARGHALGAGMARVAALAPDLFFASKIDATLTAAGHEVTIVSADAGAAAGDADVVIVDLDAAGPRRRPRPPGTPLLGFYSHVDVDTRRRAEEAGFDLVVPRSRMAREMPELVARLLRAASGAR